MTGRGRGAGELLAGAGGAGGPGRADHTVGVGGRDVGYADFGPRHGRPVLWCHGGPGSRLEPHALVPAAADAGFRIIGIDRPGYGTSTPHPGRSIGAWVDDARAVLAHAGVDRFLAVGVSTGGAYALALAAAEPGRLDGCVACCALTDMGWAEGRAMMTGESGMGRLMAGIWDATDRADALRRTVDVLGDDGARLFAQTPDTPIPAADLEFLTRPENVAAMTEVMGEMFRFGVQGFVDDRIADGVGWITFDAGSVRCPTVVLHGAADPLVPVAHAHHTASLVPRAQVRVVEDLGHFSITREIVPTLRVLAVPTPS